MAGYCNDNLINGGKMRIRNAEIEIEKKLLQNGMNPKFSISRIRWLAINSDDIVIHISNTELSPQDQKYNSDVIIKISITNDGTISCYEKNVVEEIINLFPINNYK